MACYGAPKIIELGSSFTTYTAHYQGASFDDAVISGTYTCEELADLFPIFETINPAFWHPEFSVDLTDVRFFRSDTIGESTAVLRVFLTYNDSTTLDLAHYYVTIPNGSTEGVFSADYYHGTIIGYEDNIDSLNWEIVSSTGGGAFWAIGMGVLDWSVIDWECFSSSFMTQCGVTPPDPYDEYFSSPVSISGDESTVWTPTEFADDLAAQYPGLDCAALLAQILSVIESPDFAILTPDPLEKYTSVDASGFLAAVIPECGIPPHVDVEIYQFRDGVSECANFTQFINIFGIPKGNTK